MSARDEVIEFLRPHSGRVLCACLLSLLSSACILMIPSAAQEMLRSAVSDGRRAGLLVPGLELAGGLVILVGMSAASYLLFSGIAHRVGSELRLRYVESLVRMDLNHYYGADWGSLLEHFVTSTATIERFIKYALPALVTLPVILVGGLAVAFSLSWKLSLLLLLMISIVATGFRRVVAALRTAVQKNDAATGALTSHLHELLLGLDVVRAFNGGPREIDRFRRLQSQIAPARDHEAVVSVALEHMIVAVLIGAVIVVLGVGSWLLAAGDLQPEALVGFLLLSLLIVPQARVLGLLATGWQQFGLAVRHIHGLNDIPAEMHPGNAVDFPLPVRGEVEFRDVTYLYPGRSAGIRDISFTIGAQDAVAIVGPSGAGKTTLFRLLLRMLEPRTGTISIDGLDIRRITADSLRGAMAIVPQDSTLFNDTILENVRYGRHDAHEHDVVEACVAAQADSFIRSMPQGYHTMVGERGLKLSSGERQRIAIARALLRNAPLLLLDEAASSLDGSTERQLLDAMTAAMRGRTTLVIAHRLSTVFRLSRILVVHEGRIMGDGCHEDLLRDCACYRDLVVPQLFPFPGTAHPVPVASAQPEFAQRSLP